ncbi:MAG: 5'-3' exonuclease H3TH domain-containing protein, partial [Desulfovibrionaceae bacterium]|nr:5'-3' exonuclease H3TH domain-containing protein [Desulfovibrionaceae bacterium]
VEALGIRYEVSEGCEADDCIASLAARFSAEHPVIIVSGDKDLKQCLAPNVYMWDPGTREEKLLSEAQFRAESGIDPAHWPDVQALIGDTSDNIPGVPGIGPKTAEKIFGICPSLEDIRDHFDRLPPKVQDKLREHLDKIFLWRQLTTLSRDVCSHLRLADMAVRPPDVQACQRLSEEFELMALRRDMAALIRRQGQDGGAAPVALAAVESPAAAGVRPAEAGLLSLLHDVQTPLAPEINGTEQLPACTGKSVALIWPRGSQQPPHLAIEGGEEDFCWTGRMDALCRWLRQSGRLVLSDLKALLVAAPCWRELLAGPQGPQPFDLGVAAWLLEPEEADYGWPRLATRWGAATGAGGAGPARLALRIAAVLEARLEEQGLRSLYDGLEMPLTPVLAEMEGRGIAIDAAAFHAFLAEVQARLDGLTADVYAAAGTRF